MNGPSELRFRVENIRSPLGGKLARTPIGVNLQEYGSLNVRALARVRRSLAVVLGLATEVRSRGRSVALIVQIPEGGVVSGKHDSQVHLNHGGQAMLTVDVEAGEEAAGVMLGAPLVLDQLAANVFEAARTAAKGTILTEAPVASGRETIAGRAAYLYRGALTNRRGVRMEFELWIVAIDDAHVGFIALAGGSGTVSTQRLRQVARAARLSNGS